ncbi:hypothetical protein F4553_001854 [Allocatelliglobosispora scoriae]|uniref:Uncharacterized protein n=1 Tax=Allocatelliglobosispora scoriae TaxID=643052 RepID=A0A841BLG3_9ACTN|nr:hypothetical protein [Allocatelliglobosispora scoriae]MBB5868475.1 hypothetical protein [Allocatelliglobosispora scoriae]
MRTIHTALFCAITLTAAALVGPASAAGSPLGAALPVHIDAAGAYQSVQPTRILDTRSGLGAPDAPIGPAGTLQLQVLGQGGVPASGVSTVVLNVTVTAPSVSGYLTVYPSGTTRPNSSSVNFAAGWTGANSVTVTVGTDGHVVIFNAAGTVEVIADVVGYYLSATGTPSYSASSFVPLTAPIRLLDSRTGSKLAAGRAVVLGVEFGANNFNITSYAVTVTAVSPEKNGYLATGAWDDNGVGTPTTSTLNFKPGAVVPNFAIVPTGFCNGIGCPEHPLFYVYNGSSGATHVIVDVVGVYTRLTGSLQGSRFVPREPARVVDTRTGLGGWPTFTPKDAYYFSFWADETTAAIAVNVTAVAPTRSTYLKVWQGGDTSIASNLNPAAGQTVANAAVTPLGTYGGTVGRYWIYNDAGETDVLVDVIGVFVGAAAVTGLVAEQPFARFN